MAANPPEERSAAALMDAVMWNKEPIGGPFALIDHNGERRTDTDFRGKLLLIYFGFTFCSDMCPIDLQSMATSARQARAWPASRCSRLFITVDPEKDTPEQLKGYVALVPSAADRAHRQSPARSSRSRCAYKVYYAKTEPSKQDGDRASTTPASSS